MTKTKDHLTRIIRSFRGATIGVFGDFMLDELMRGDASRISPEAPVPVVLFGDGDGAQGYPGGGGNVAANLAALGARPIPFGAIGSDESGEKVRALLRTRKIRCDHLVRERGRMTPRKVRIVAHQQQLLRLDFEKPASLSPRSADLILQGFLRCLKRLDALVISDYRKGSVTTELSSRMSALARQRRVPVLVDPKPDHPEICRHATFVTPNLHEAEIMVGGKLRSREALWAAGRRLRAELDCRNLLITRGSEGMTLFDSNGAVDDVPGVTRPVYDVTGAGDTVIAVLALALASGATPRQAAELANIAGGLVVVKFGTAELSATEILEAVSNK